MSRLFPKTSGINLGRSAGDWHVGQRLSGVESDHRIGEVTPRVLKGAHQVIATAQAVEEVTQAAANTAVDTVEIPVITDHEPAMQLPASSAFESQIL